ALQSLPARTFARPRADVERTGLAPPYYRHSMPRSHGRAGSPMAERAAAVLARRTPARIRQCGHAKQAIGSKDVLAKRRVGPRRVDCRATRGHGSALANQLMQSAQAWLRRNNRRPLGPALTPAGSARRDGRRQGIGNVWDTGGAVGGGNAAGIDPNLGKS